MLKKIRAVRLMGLIAGAIVVCGVWEVATAAQSNLFQIKNKTGECFSVTLFCEDGSICSTIFDGKGVQMIDVPSDVVGVQVNDAEFVYGDHKHITTDGGEVVSGDFNKDDKFIVSEDDCSRD